MDLSFDDMTPMSGLAALVVVAGTVVVLYGQFHVSLIDFAEGAMAPSGANLSPETRARLEHYRGVRLAGGGVMAAGVVVFLFDVVGGTALIADRLRGD